MASRLLLSVAVLVAFLEKTVDTLHRSCHPHTIRRGSA